MMASNGARPAVGRPPWGPLPVDDHDQRHLTTPSPSVATATHPPGSPALTKTADTAPVDAIAVIPSMGWTAAGGLVLRIDPVTRHTVVVPGIEIVAPPVVGLAAGAGTVWATTTAGRPLLRVDPGTARAAASLSVPAQAVAADRSGVWVRGTGRLLWRIDPTSNRVVATIPLPSGPTDGGDGLGTGEPGGDIAVTEDAVWVSDPAVATVWRIDPVTTGWTVPAGRRAGASWRWRPLATVACGWARPRGCSTSTSASCARNSTARPVERSPPVPPKPRAGPRPA
jgi:hypothetical protein